MHHYHQQNHHPAPANRYYGQNDCNDASANRSVMPSTSHHTVAVPDHPSRHPQSFTMAINAHDGGGDVADAQNRHYYYYYQNANQNVFVDDHSNRLPNHGYRKRRRNSRTDDDGADEEARDDAARYIKCRNDVDDYYNDNNNNNSNNNGSSSSIRIGKVKEET